MAEKKTRNPFYVLVALSGIAFAITACAYGVMTVQMLNMANGGPRVQSRLLEFLDERGGVVLMVELAVLAVSSVGAISLDSYRTSSDTATATSTPDDGG